MDMPPPGTCHRCKAETLPYAEYRRSRRRNTSDPTVHDDPWGCLSTITLFAEDISQFFASFRGITRRREIARARAQYFQPDDVTLVCTEGEWTAVGDVPPCSPSGPA
ncbi:hypothetical protein ACINK0_05655 [Deinococcus sp. VB343]|uniref:hypothetical protein n=1 Tax=Deinococcus sp. VB343 TaxID=3385567 RepID=UPI0039C9B7F9